MLCAAVLEGPSRLAKLSLAGVEDFGGGLLKPPCPGPVKGVERPLAEGDGVGCKDGYDRSGREGIDVGFGGALFEGAELQSRPARSSIMKV